MTVDNGRNCRGAAYSLRQATAKLFNSAQKPAASIGMPNRIKETATPMENLAAARAQKRLAGIKRWSLMVSFAFAVSAHAADLAPLRQLAQQSKASSTERQRQLETQAKKEGRVIFYG